MYVSPTSLLSVTGLSPVAFQRASLYKPGFVTGVTGI